MRQFEIFPNPSERSRAIAPFVVCLQSHHLAALPSCIVAPLLIDDDQTAYTEISVRVAIDGRRYVVFLAEMAAIDSRLLRNAIGDLRAYEDQLRRGLDRIFTGF